MAERPPHEVAEILQRYLEGQLPSAAPEPEWSWDQRAAVDAILACRTARLGGHVDECDACGHQIAHNPRHLGARLGFFAILHTWGQTLVHHPHVHCVVPAGGLAEDGRSWKPCRPGFFLPVRVLSRLFRGKFLAELSEAFRDGRLEFHGCLAPYRNSAAFNRLLHEACRTDWVVYAKPPFDRPEHVLEYLARYTHRVALSNHRLLHVDDQGVTFRFKDYRSCRARSLTLSLQEFVRRFLLHVLPRGFVRIRYYGFLANGSRARLLSCCRGALGLADVSADPPPEHAEDREVFNALLNLPARDLRPCPQCSRGLLRCVQILERPPPSCRRSRHVAA